MHREPYLKRTVAFLRKVIEKKTINFDGEKRKPRAFFLGDFIEITPDLEVYSEESVEDFIGDQMISKDDVMEVEKNDLNREFQHK